LKNAPGFTSGLVLGIIFLVVGLGILILAPEFSGFYERVEPNERMPIWALMLGLALVNFLYAVISQFLGKKGDGTISTTSYHAETDVVAQEEKDK